MEKNRIKLAALGILMAGAFTYLFLFGMRDSMVYYLTLEELESSAAQTVGEGIRLAGRVKEGSVQGTVVDGGITFVMTDGNREIRVRYSGQIPDSFQDGSDVVVEGIYRAHPVFSAATLLAKCPSKYETKGDPDSNSGKGARPL